MQIAAYDTLRANAPYRAALSEAAEAVLSSNQLILGDRLMHFERDFAAYCGTSSCVGVGNGLDALALTLTALQVGPGDEVIVPAFTFIATWLSVIRVGARPVPVDVQEDGLIDPVLIEKAITARTRAIVPVHLFGRLADMEAITVMAQRAGISVVEDAAQAHGAERNGRRAGSFGVAAAFSFYPTKNLGALGDGGAVCTNNPELAAVVRRLRNYGSDTKYHHEIIGQNSRLDELQAAFLSVKLPCLDSSNTHRQVIAEQYHAAFSAHRIRDIITPSLCGSTVWHQFVIQSKKRDELQEELKKRGIGTMIHYPVAPFDQPCFEHSYLRNNYPVAIRLTETVLSLPMGDYLTVDEVEYIVRALALHSGALRAA
jgi:dTDP-4-amino-4,6-dideoxygalactose transaminase